MVKQFAIALRAPKRADKPGASACGKTRTRVCAFTGKTPSKSVPRKPGEDAQDEAAGAARPGGAHVANVANVAKNAALVAWLERGNGDREGCNEAREYLMLGAPYRGESDFDAKDAVKATDAAHWCANPLKQRGVRDGLAAGWWSAHTEEELKTLIGMPRDGCDGRKRRVWRGLDVPDESHVAILTLLAEFEGYEHREQLKRNALATVARAAAATRSEALANSSLFVPPDDDAELAQLRGLGVEWSVDMAAQSGRANCLGPKSGLSCAARTLRGLRLELIAVEAINAGRWGARGRPGRRADASLGAHKRVPVPVPVPKPVPKRGRAVAAAAAAAAAHGDEQLADAEPDAEPAFADYTRTEFSGPSSGCYMFGSGLGSAKEWERMRDAQTTRDLARVKPHHPQSQPSQPSQPTWCTECLHQVCEQFNDCSCLAAPRVWRWCGECLHGCCKQQPCACACAGQPDPSGPSGSDVGPWHARQAAAQRAARRAADEADRMVARMEAGE